MANSASARRAPVLFVVPGRLETRTGGYGYDRRIIAGLRGLGWPVEVVEIEGTFPSPSRRTLDQLAATLARAPDGATVVVDGLAFGAAPDEVCREATRVRLVAVVHHPLARETGIDAATELALEAAEARALTSACAVAVTSRATGRSLAAYGVPPDHITVVEPGTDRARLALGSTDGLMRLLAVGAVVPRKGYDVLLDALASIPERNWRLTLVGSLDRDPATAAALCAQLLATGLHAHVELVGEVASGDIDARYAAADVFVLPTFHEGYGMAIAEALARGLPVISTRTGGIPDMVGDDAGLLVPAGDRAALAEALSRVLSGAGERARLAVGARRARRRLPSWDEASARFSAVLDQVAAGG